MKLLYLLRMPWRESLDRDDAETAAERVRSEAGADDLLGRAGDALSHDARTCHAVGCHGVITPLFFSDVILAVRNY